MLVAGFRKFALTQGRVVSHGRCPATCERMKTTGGGVGGDSRFPYWRVWLKCSSRTAGGFRNSLVQCLKPVRCEFWTRPATAEVHCNFGESLRREVKPSAIRPAIFKVDKEAGHRSRLSVVLLVLLGGVIFLLGGCSSGSEVQKPPAETGRFGKEDLIYTSIYPVYYFTSFLAGDKNEVRSLLPAGGGEAHNLEPSIRALKSLEAAKALVVSGAGMEPWLDRVLANLKSPPGVIVAATPLVTHEKQGYRTFGEEQNPHFWLDPVLAKVMVEEIAQGLSRLDQVNAAYYQERTAELTARLEVLDNSYSQALSGLTKHSFVVAHAAFDHLAKRYGLEQIALVGPNNDEAEPTVGRLVEVSRLVKSRGLRYIFYEEAAGSKLARVLAEEVGAGILPLDPLEILSLKKLQAGEDYFSVMESNLRNLVLGLQ